MPSKASLRNDGNNPFLYLEDSGGSTCFGVDDATNRVNLITSNAVTNIEPSSGSAVFSVDQTANGNIEFAPHGSGQSTFLNGDVQIAAGNLDMQNTSLGGTEGVINFGGSRFIHNKGNQNTFIGEVAGNLSNTGTSNTVIGASSTSLITTASSNIIIGASSCGSLTTASTNIVIGNSAMISASSASTSNIIIGNSTLNDATSADLNIAVGHGALDSLITGDTNIAIGINAGNAFTGAESNNITIGHLGVVADSGAIRIGTSGTQTTAFIAGVNGVSVTAAGTVVISSTGQLGTTPATPTAWNEVTAASAAMVVNNGYIANRATLVTLSLPATAALGSRFEIVGKGVGGWLISQGAGQTIHFGILNSTTGVGGSIASTAQYDCVELICITANTDFIVKSSVGNITVV